MDILSWNLSDRWCTRFRRLSLWNTKKKRGARTGTRANREPPAAATLRSLTREVTCADAMRRRSIATVTQQPTTSSPHSTTPLSITPIAEEELEEEFGRENGNLLDEALMQVSLQCTLIQDECSFWASPVSLTKEGLASLEDVRDPVSSVAPPLETHARHVVEIESFQTKPLDEALMVDDECSDTSTLVDCCASTCDFPREREKIRQFSDDPRCIVDESVDPERAPHIVVTRAEECWEDFFIAYSNGVDHRNAMQEYLTVPFLDWTGRSKMHPTPVAEPDHQPPLQSAPTAPTTFLLSDLHKLTTLSQLPQQGMSISEDIYRQLFAYAALEAGTSASALRELYDQSMEMFASFERPFMWKDPAQPILAAPGPGAITILSTYPIRAPHIIVHTAFPSLPAVVDMNRTPLLQDAAFGQLLTVKSCMVEVVNELESWSDTSSEQSEPDLAVEELPEDDFSRPESPTPQTPLVEELEGFNYNAEPQSTPALMELEELIEWDVGATDENPIDVDISISDKISLDASSSCCLDPEFRIEEDEEELPSLDDW